MKKKNLASLLALSFSSLALAACGTEDGPIGSNSELPPISIGDEELSYLRGTFYGDGGTLTLSKEKLSLIGKEELSLVPTGVGTVEIAKAVEETTLVPAVFFAPEYNAGGDYRLFADVEGDGFVHLEKKEGEAYEEMASFQPDASMYASPFTFDGSGDEWNARYIFDGSFDFERDVYPVSFQHASVGWSTEQAWHALSRIRLDSQDNPFVTLEFFDADDYGYGETEARIEGGKVALYEDAETLTWLSDEGIFRDLALFDGEKGVSIEADPEERSIAIGNEEGTYVSGTDERGFYLEATLGERNVRLRMGDRYATMEEKGKEAILPLDTIEPMLGAFTDKKDEFGLSYEEGTGYEATWNGEAVALSYAIENKRKALSFKDGSDSILVSPDKDGSSVRVTRNGAASYFINAQKYDALFSDYFVAKGEKEFTILVDDDFDYAYGGESGKAFYSYWHGDKFPSLALGEGKKISIVQEEAGYFLLVDGQEKTDLYSGEALKRVFGEYSSDGSDALTLDMSAITLDGKRYAYAFKPYYDEKTGISIFAIESALGSFKSNLDSCLYSESASYVKKEVLSSIEGTYSAYGQYGLENIEFTSGWKLRLDVVNDGGDGLLKDQEKPYSIYTEAGGDTKAVLGFEHGGYIVYIRFYEGYVSIMGLNYYEQDMVLGWGTYVDSERSHALYLQDDKIYYDGTALSVTSKAKTANSVVYETDQGTLFVSKGADGEVAIAFGGASFERELSFEDYGKFVGTYVSGDSEVTVSKTSLSYEIAIKGAFSKLTISDVRMVLKDGKVALKASYALTTYYLILGESGAVSLTVEAASLPPLPPLL